MRRRAPLVVGLFLIVFLGLLAAGLRGFEFEGRAPHSGAQPLADRAAAPEAGGSPGLLWLVPAVAGLFALVAVVTLLLYREVRREFLLRLLVAAVLVGVLVGVLSLIRQQETAIERAAEPPTATTAPASNGAGEAAVAPVPDAPGWAPYALSAAIVLALGYVVLRVTRRRSGTAERDEAAELAAAAADGAAALRDGAPLTEVVQKCWALMSLILSSKTPVRNAPQLTPREFAMGLRARGFQDDAVDRLTSLFEEVRYGQRESEPRRGEALAALAAIERRFGDARTSS